MVRRTAARGPQRPAPGALDARPHHRRRLRPARRTGPQHPARGRPGTPPGPAPLPRRPARQRVVEAFASITAGDRVQAMAFRLEQGPDQRWRCAAVELGGERLTAGHPGPR
ncbi:Rv3235 family protein [Streptomyces microflavus]